MPYIQRHTSVISGSNVGHKRLTAQDVKYEMDS